MIQNLVLFDPGGRLKKQSYSLELAENYKNQLLKTFRYFVSNDC